MTGEAQKIEAPASQPDADLACDFSIALTEVGLRDRLLPLVAAPPKRIEGGIEMTFEPQAWDDVRRYIEVESQCCPFLTLSASQDADSVTLRVTGRPEAQDVISEIFRDTNTAG
jgi:hypothetical protein